MMESTNRKAPRVEEILESTPWCHVSWLIESQLSERRALWEVTVRLAVAGSRKGLAAAGQGFESCGAYGVAGCTADRRGLIFDPGRSG
jgi:hypothetical protein